MNHGGRIALLGIPPSSMAIDWNQVIFKGLVIKGIYGREMFETWYKMASLIQSGLDISQSSLTTSKWMTSKRLRHHAQRASGKVILDWQ